MTTARRTRAAVYVASGNAVYVREAVQSARSLRRHMPELPIYLKVSSPDLLGPDDAAFFDRVLTIASARPGSIDKAGFLDDLGEEEVLFLDGDTQVCGDLSDGFALLERFDFAAAHAPIRACVPHDRLGVPAAFPEFNSGVMFARNRPAVHAAMARWRALQPEIGHRQDQPALRKALWESELRIATMPPEWNARLVFPTYVAEPIRIIHARFADMARAERQANRYTGQRILHPPAFMPLLRGAWWRLERTLRRHRPRHRLRLLIARLRGGNSA